MAVAGLGYGIGSYYYDPRNASYQEIQSLNSYLVDKGLLQEQDTEIISHTAEDKKEKTDYYNALRAWRDVQYHIGNMVGYRQAQRVCDAWTNEIDKQENKEKEVGNGQDTIKAYRKEGSLESGVLGLSVFGNGTEFYTIDAFYAENSTAENPIVEVRISAVEGLREFQQTQTYGTKKEAKSAIVQMTMQIAVNQVNAESASQLEMFALCVHGDRQGAEGFSKTGDSYQKLLTGLSDKKGGQGENFLTAAETIADFCGKKQDWTSLKKTEQELVNSLLEERNAALNGVPYGYLAKDGIIEYNGVVFVCDEKQRALCLGNTTDMDKCLRIPLSGGGSLIVNRDNLGDLSKAISMFSPEDINLIMRAITLDAKVQQIKHEIDDEKNTPFGAGTKAEQTEEKTEE